MPSLVPRTHIGVDGDAVVSGVPQLLLGDFDVRIARKEEGVGAG